ncbi:hypothetical protein QFC22_001042 [Naganishia vaughanmartiniae]|uniref:Uncharacterized protein n=1 Tax=Naganishia vaughanmartiniae TaxID=1424756 RepID=A0ACC2XK63_9TREE|nr:hypothetical protein QFC22_001042 [Naganishia vaughanmartiniae]
MSVNPRTQILALVAPKRFRYSSFAPLAQRQLATQPPRADLDPPLSASTQDLLNRLAKEAAKNNAPGATVRPGGSALGGESGAGKPYVGSVGPFGLGVGLGSNIRNKEWKKWRELGLGGKGKSIGISSLSCTDDYADGEPHSTYQIFTHKAYKHKVILFGGTLFALLAYALTTELFAKNSPTVLHNQAIDMIESSKVPFRDARGWLEVQYEQLMEQYLMDRLDDGDGTAPMQPADRVDVAQGVKKQEESSWFGGMFGALKPSSQGSSRNAGKARKALPPAGTYTSGEVHADFLKVRSLSLSIPPSPCLFKFWPYFAFANASCPTFLVQQDPETQTYRLLTLTVDIPSAKSGAQRAVVFWGDQDEVAREGLLEGSRTRLTW